MKREYFITKKVISKILTKYGGRRKYVLSERYTTDKQYEIVFTEKENKYKWLCMHSYKGDVLVTLTDETGRVVEENYFTIDGELKEMHLEEQEELKIDDKEQVVKNLEIEKSAVTINKTDVEQNEDEEQNLLRTGVIRRVVSFYKKLKEPKVGQTL